MLFECWPSSEQEPCREITLTESKYKRPNVVFAEHCSLIHEPIYNICRYIAPKVSRRIASVVRKEAIINGILLTSKSYAKLTCANSRLDRTSPNTLSRQCHYISFLIFLPSSFSPSCLLKGSYGSFSAETGGWDPKWDTPRKIVTMRPYRGHKRERSRPER